MRTLLALSTLLGLALAYDYSSDDDEQYSGLSCNCGWRNGGRIVGGKETKKNEYPWMAAIRDPRDGFQFCGGSIISERHILTAAHCTKGVSARDMVVSVGTHNLNHDDDQLIPVSRIHQHERYDHRITVNDISILELAEPIRFNQNVGPICLPNKKLSLVGQFIKVTGWGLTNPNSNDGSQVLLEVDLRVQSPSDCIRQWPGFQDNPVSQLCAIGNGNKDSCNGDSGGPLIWLDPETNRYTQVALVSYGSPRCGDGKPSVNTDVSFFIDWIRSKVAGKGQICTKN